RCPAARIAVNRSFGRFPFGQRPPLSALPVGQIAMKVLIDRWRADEILAKFLPQATNWRGRPTTGGRMHQAVNSRLRFDRFTLDLARESLRLGGEEIVLRPKTFNVLRHLAENAGRLVLKQDLHEAVWPGVAVTDDSLVHCIRELRQ